MESLKHFLNRTESQLRGEAIALEKSCLALQAWTDKYQQDNRRDLDMYRNKQVLNKRTNTNEESGVLSEGESVRSRKKRSVLKDMRSEIKELDAMMKRLTNEKKELHTKWRNYEAREFVKRPKQPSICREEHNSV